MAERPKARFIKVPNLLAAKVTVEDEDAETKFAKARAVLREMQDDYLSWAEADLEALRRALEAAKASPGEAREHLETIHRIAHDMKGQGRVFGYPLATEIGESLCQFTREVETAGATEIAIIENHIDALAAIIHRRIKGDGGEIGRQVTFGLKAAVDKLLSLDEAKPGADPEA